MNHTSTEHNFKLKTLKVGELDLSLVILDMRVPEIMQAYMVLFEMCFGKRHNIDASLFDWLNNKSPNYKNLNFAFIDNNNNQLICAYGLLPADANLNGSILKYALCTNVMTHPDYAGNGLFALIGKEALSYAKSIGINFSFGVPNEQAVKGHLKLGWKIINELSFFQRDQSGDVESESEIIPDILNRMSNPDLFSFSKNKYNFFFLRTLSWLRWRINKPHSTYLNFGLHSEAHKGYVILKQYTDVVTNKRKLHIVDFGYENIETFTKLISHCAWYMQSNNFDLLNLWHYSFNKTETEVLLEKGFKEMEQKNPIIINDLGNGLPIPSGYWHVTLFDNDVY